MLPWLPWASSVDARPGAIRRNGTELVDTGDQPTAGLDSNAHRGHERGSCLFHNPKTQPSGRPAKLKCALLQLFHAVVTQTPCSGLAASTIFPPPMYMATWWAPLK